MAAAPYREEKSISALVTTVSSSTYLFTLLLCMHINNCEFRFSSYFNGLSEFQPLLKVTYQLLHLVHLALGVSEYDIRSSTSRYTTDLCHAISDVVIAFFFLAHLTKR